MFVSYIFYLFPTLDYESRNGVTLNEDLDGVAEPCWKRWGVRTAKAAVLERGSLPFSQY